MGCYLSSSNYVRSLTSQNNLEEGFKMSPNFGIGARKAASTMALVALTLLLGASRANAQLWQAGPPGDDLGSLALLVGSVVPQSDLPDGASFASGTALGASATWWPFRHVGFRGNFVRTETEGREGDEFSSVAFESPIVLLYSADVALRLPLELSRLALVPYIAAGYGGKSYRWSLNRVSAGGGGNTSFGWTLAGGTELRLLSSSVGLRLEVLNQHSEFRFFEYAGPNSRHEFYRDEVVVHDVVPGELSYPTLNDMIFTVALTVNR